MTRTIIDVHVLQTLPPSNVNRDDTGSPKTAVYGGVRRARVSSQAWKKATRTAFETTLDRDGLGVRTKRVLELIGEEITRQSSDLAEQSIELAKQIITTAGIKVSAPRQKERTVEESGYLIFLSTAQVRALAALAVESARSGQPLAKAAVRAKFGEANSIDVALFGRMVADVADLNVDAAAQVAHAISTHAVSNEFDFFTAVDDRKHGADEDAGAGMMGTVEFNSSTLYRYACLDVDQLQRNMGDTEATARAAAEFVRAFLVSMPTGKQNTFANNTVPDAVLVTVRGDQPISFVGAFEEPVTASGSAGQLSASVDALVTQAKDIHDAYGTPESSWVFGIGDKARPVEAVGERVSRDQLVDGITQAVRERLGAVR